MEGESPTLQAKNLARCFGKSWDRLQDELGRKILFHAAAFAPGEKINLDWLKKCVEAENKEFNFALKHIGDCGLGRVDEQNFWLHRLLASFIATKAGKDMPEYREKTGRVINKIAFANNKSGFPARMLPILPHLEHAALQAGDSELGGALYNNWGGYWDIAGEYAQARPLYEKSLAIREKALEPDHPDTASSLNNLAELYKSQGEYAQARPLLEKSLAIWEKVLGPDHPNTKQVRANYGYLLAEMSKRK